MLMVMMKHDDEGRIMVMIILLINVIVILNMHNMG